MRVLYFFVLTILFGCVDKKKTEVSSERHLSSTEIGLKKLLDSFKLEYKNAKTGNFVDSVVDKYNEKIFKYLASHSIDSISVRVDTVIINGMTITTKFHNKDNIAFQYGLTFTKPMTKYFDSLFNFMNGLKIGTDTTISFSYMGSHQLNNSNDSSLPGLRVFAIPSFLKAKR